MKVSIVIPTYNVSKYITECLESIARQTFNGEIECILVDDCSKDNSVQIIEEYIKKYIGRFSFKLIQRLTNGGASAARNTGTIQATGEYIMFVDGDDMLTPNCLEDMTNLLREHPNVDMIHAGIKTTNGEMEQFDREKHPLEEYTDDYKLIKTELIGKEIIPASPCNKLLPLEFIRSNNLYFQEGIVMEDVLWCNLLAKTVRSVGCLNKNTYIYRIHEGSIVTSGLGVDPNRKLIVYDLIADILDEPYIDEQVKYLIYRLDRVYFETSSIETRKEVCRISSRLLKYLNTEDKIRMKLKLWCSKFDKGNYSLGYYFYAMLSSDYSYLKILNLIIKRLFRKQ